MSTKRIGWCRINQELVLDISILNVPYLRDDMVVYRCKNGSWDVWTPERQAFMFVRTEEVPAVIKLAMVMIE